MNHCLIICRSITYAQRASRAMRGRGITHQIMRVPVGLVRSGCGYAIKIRRDHLKDALAAMARERMRPQYVFASSTEGYYEVTHDIF